MAENEDVCSNCGCLTVEFLSEDNGETVLRCLNPKCRAVAFVETPDGMMIYDRDPLKT